MANDPTVSLNVHVNDETKMGADRVPSGSADFASVKIGWQVSILLFTTEQAKALADAADEAYYILRGIEDEKARHTRAAAREDWGHREVNPDPELERLLMEEEEIERRMRYNDEEENFGSSIRPCTISNPCEDCLDMYDDPYPYEHESF